MQELREADLGAQTGSGKGFGLKSDLIQLPLGVLIFSLFLIFGSETVGSVLAVCGALALLFAVVTLYHSIERPRPRVFNIVLFILYFIFMCIWVWYCSRHVTGAHYTQLAFDVVYAVLAVAYVWWFTGYFRREKKKSARTLKRGRSE